MMNHSLGEQKVDIGPAWESVAALGLLNGILPPQPHLGAELISAPLSLLRRQFSAGSIADLQEYDNIFLFWDSSGLENPTSPSRQGLIWPSFPLMPTGDSEPAKSSGSPASKSGSREQTPLNSIPVWPYLCKDEAGLETDSEDSFPKPHFLWGDQPSLVSFTALSPLGFWTDTPVPCEPSIKSTNKSTKNNIEREAERSQPSLETSETQASIMNQDDTGNGATLNAEPPVLNKSEDQSLESIQVVSETLDSQTGLFTAAPDFNPRFLETDISSVQRANLRPSLEEEGDPSLFFNSSVTAAQLEAHERSSPSFVETSDDPELASEDSSELVQSSLPKIAQEGISGPEQPIFAPTSELGEDCERFQSQGVLPDAVAAEPVALKGADISSQVRDQSFEGAASEIDGFEPKQYAPTDSREDLDFSLTNASDLLLQASSLKADSSSCPTNEATSPDNETKIQSLEPIEARTKGDTRNVEISLENDPFRSHGDSVETVVPIIIESLEHPSVVRPVPPTDPAPAVTESPRSKEENLAESVNHSPARPDSGGLLSWLNQGASWLWSQLENQGTQRPANVENNLTQSNDPSASSDSDPGLQAATPASDRQEFLIEVENLSSSTKVQGSDPTASFSLLDEIQPTDTPSPALEPDATSEGLRAKESTAVHEFVSLRQDSEVTPSFLKPLSANSIANTAVSPEEVGLPSTLDSLGEPLGEPSFPQDAVLAAPSVGEPPETADSEGKLVAHDESPTQSNGPALESFEVSHLNFEDHLGLPAEHWTPNEAESIFPKNSAGVTKDFEAFAPAVDGSSSQTCQAAVEDILIPDSLVPEIDGSSTPAGSGAPDSPDSSVLLSSPGSPSRADERSFIEEKTTIQSTFEASHPIDISPIESPVQAGEVSLNSDASSSVAELEQKIFLNSASESSRNVFDEAVLQQLQSDVIPSQTQSNLTGYREVPPLIEEKTRLQVESGTDLGMKSSSSDQQTKASDPSGPAQPVIEEKTSLQTGTEIDTDATSAAAFQREPILSVSSPWLPSEQAAEGGLNQPTTDLSFSSDEATSKSVLPNFQENLSVNSPAADRPKPLTDEQTSIQKTSESVSTHTAASQKSEIEVAAEPGSSERTVIQVESGAFAPQTLSQGPPYSPSSAETRLQKNPAIPEKQQVFAEATTIQTNAAEPQIPSTEIQRNSEERFNQNSPEELPSAPASDPLKIGPQTMIQALEMIPSTDQTGPILESEDRLDAVAETAPGELFGQPADSNQPLPLDGVTSQEPQQDPSLKSLWDQPVSSFVERTTIQADLEIKPASDSEEQVANPLVSSADSGSEASGEQAPVSLPLSSEVVPSPQRSKIEQSDFLGNTEPSELTVKAVDEAVAEQSYRPQRVIEERTVLQFIPNEQDLRDSAPVEFNEDESSHDGFSRLADPVPNNPLAAIETVASPDTEAPFSQEQNKTSQSEDRMTWPEDAALGRELSQNNPLNNSISSNLGSETFFGAENSAVPSFSAHEEDFSLSPIALPETSRPEAPQRVESEDGHSEAQGQDSTFENFGMPDSWSSLEDLVTLPALGFGEPPTIFSNQMVPETWSSLDELVDPDQNFSAQNSLNSPQEASQPSKTQTDSSPQWSSLTELIQAIQINSKADTKTEEPSVQASATQSDGRLPESKSFTLQSEHSSFISRQEFVQLALNEIKNATNLAEDFDQLFSKKSLGLDFQMNFGLTDSTQISTSVNDFIEESFQKLLLGDPEDLSWIMMDMVTHLAMRERDDDYSFIKKHTLSDF